MGIGYRKRDSRTLKIEVDMHVRPLEESADRYVRNSIQAYLDGAKNLAWVTGVIKKSGVPLMRCHALYVSRATVSSRSAELADWFRRELNGADVPRANTRQLLT
jgi:hypothetical protein